MDTAVIKAVPDEEENEVIQSGVSHNWPALEKIRKVKTKRLHTQPDLEQIRRATTERLTLCVT